jgi:hypothetical protein
VRFERSEQQRRKQPLLIPKHFGAFWEEVAKIHSLSKYCVVAIGFTAIVAEEPFSWIIVRSCSPGKLLRFIKSYPTRKTLIVGEFSTHIVGTGRIIDYTHVIYLLLLDRLQTASEISVHIELHSVICGVINNNLVFVSC